MYPEGSKIAELEKRHTEAVARHEDARHKAGALADRLRAAEDAWARATWETTTVDDFLRLGAERELLLRSLGRARQELDAADHARAVSRQAFEQAARSLLASQDRLARAEYRGDTKTVAEASSAIAAWTEAG